MRVARRRQLTGVLTLIALLAIVLGVSGFQLTLPHPGLPGASAVERPLFPGVRAVASSVLLKVGAGAPRGGELAFLALAPSGNLIVSDSRRRSVLRFDPGGQLLSEWGPALGETTIGQPAGVAATGDAVYVLDRGSEKILRLDGAGRLQNVTDLAALGTYGLNGLALDPGGAIYAADTGRNRILILASTGALLRQIGHAGNDLGGLTQPMALAFAPDAAFFVADWENSRIERFDSSGMATDAWPIGFRSFGVAVDQLGRVYVPDSDRRRVEVYTPQGAPLGELATGDVSPRQVVAGRPGVSSLYALGPDAIVRLDLQNTPPPPQGTASDVDVESLAVIGLLLGTVLLAVLSRRRRRPLARGSVGAALERPVGLHSENRAQSQQQQARGNQNLLLTH